MYRLSDVTSAFIECPDCGSEVFYIGRHAYYCANLDCDGQVEIDTSCACCSLATYSVED